MQTLTFECEVDETGRLVLRLPPSVQPGRHRIAVVIDPLEQEQQETPTAQKITFEQFLAHRLKRPEGIPPVTLEDMEKAIIQGALDGNV